MEQEAKNTLQMRVQALRPSKEILIFMKIKQSYTFKIEFSVLCTMNLKVSLGLLLVVILQACSSIEVTQSRYGNGIGISFDQSSKNEEARVAEFRKRKHDEAMDRKYAVNPQPRILKEIAILPSNVARHLNREIPQNELQAEQHNSLNSGGEASTASKKLYEPMGENDIIEEVKSLEELRPESVHENQGNTYNLGYIGIVLIIAGLVLLLVGIPQAFSVIVLGVVLIILAYFLG